MDRYEFSFCGETLEALSSGALHWPRLRCLVVSDLHFGKSERIARRGGAILPPYETEDTLMRLEAVIAATQPQLVISLGDSFDDLTAAQSLDGRARDWLARLKAGRRWVWITGNHDPGPLDMGGEYLAELTLAPLLFRHIATAEQPGEISGHCHPKVQISSRAGRVARPCFLVDETRIILPAFGTYTGGLSCTDPVLQGLMGAKARAILTGARAIVMPMPR